MSARRGKPGASWIRTPTVAENRAAVDDMARLAGRPLPFGGEHVAPRDKPVAHEAAEQAALTRLVRSRWYAPGYRHMPQETIGRAEALSRYRAGRTPGLLDTRLWIPAVDVHSPRLHRLPVRAVLELKRADAKPKRDPGEAWWLDWRPEVDPIKAEPTRHGLMLSQAIELQLAHAVGYETMVAYGALEAIAWLDEVAGREPERMPEGWQ